MSEYHTLRITERRLGVILACVELASLQPSLMKEAYENDDIGEALEGAVRSSEITDTIETLEDALERGVCIRRRDAGEAIILDGDE